MNTEKTRTYSIVDGPNRDLIVDAFKYAYDKDSTLPVDFSVAIGYTTKPGEPGCAYIKMAIKNIVIARIEHECGNGHSYNLFGYCKADLRSFGGVGKDYKDYSFTAYYNAKTRSGTISFA